MRLETLSDQHPVHTFTCGTRSGASAIDQYLRTQALPEQAAGLAAVWVAVDEGTARDEDAIVGFFTLSPIAVRLSPAVLAAAGVQHIPYPMVGGYLLGRMGVAEQYQGHGYGELLVAAAYTKAGDLRESGGGVFLAVDPKNEALASWYDRLEFGFRTLDPANPRSLRRIVKLR